MKRPRPVIRQPKQGRRPHFIPEHAAAKGYKQRDIVKLIDADKGQVSRWFAGATPLEEWQEKLARLLGTTPDGLFKHPDEAWLANFMAGRSEKQVEKIKATLEAAFPDRE